MMMLFRSVFTVMVFYSTGSSPRCLYRIFCRILALALSNFTFRDLLFTVVIHLLVKKFVQETVPI